MVKNPFILYDYESENLFCDRQEETLRLKSLVANGNNVALIAPRRIGKTGLIEHLFHQEDIQRDYYTFHIDIYSTKNLQEMIGAMGRDIIEALKSRSRKLLEQFFRIASSLQSSISFDVTGNPSWDLSVGNIRLPEQSLDEIFLFLESADKPCIVAIDEFQTITQYPETKVEALLRTYIQRCHNTHFIYAGSQRTMMARMFSTYSRPFYMSTTPMSIDVISLDKYTAFAQRLFRDNNKEITAEAVEKSYQMFDGITWYVQKMMNQLFILTAPNQQCTEEMVDDALELILKDNNGIFESLLFQLPSKQKDLLIAICQEGKAQQITSGKFIKKYHLTSASSVQSAIKGLLDKEFVTMEMGTYEVYDKFFGLWLVRQ